MLLGVDKVDVALEYRCGVERGEPLSSELLLLKAVMCMHGQSGSSVGIPQRSDVGTAGKLGRCSNQGKAKGLETFNGVHGPGHQEEEMANRWGVWDGVFPGCKSLGSVGLGSASQHHPAHQPAAAERVYYSACRCQVSSAPP